MYLGRSETIKTTLNVQRTQSLLKMARKILCSGVLCDWCGTQGKILHPCSLEHVRKPGAGLGICFKLTFSISRQSSGTMFAVVIAIRNRPDL